MRFGVQQQRLLRVHWDHRRGLVGDAIASDRQRERPDRHVERRQSVARVVLHDDRAALLHVLHQALVRAAQHAARVVGADADDDRAVAAEVTAADRFVVEHLHREADVRQVLGDGVARSLNVADPSLRQPQRQRHQPQPRRLQDDLHRDVRIVDDVFAVRPAGAVHLDRRLDLYRLRVLRAASLRNARWCRRRRARG